MTNPKSECWRGIIGAAAAILIIIGGLVVSRLPLNFEGLAEFGYLGVFLTALIGSATVFFPVPHLAVIFSAGALLNPLFVALAGGVGSTLGELAGYFAGRGGKAVVKDARWLSRVEQWFYRYGFVAVFAMALIPNPFFDLAGIVAGGARYSPIKFILACLTGRLLRALVTAYLGHFVA